MTEDEIRKRQSELLMLVDILAQCHISSLAQGDDTSNNILDSELKKKTYNKNVYHASGNE
jgi:hypothetical protein